jgi:hypothetical protein
LWLTNQYRIYLTNHLENIEVNLEIMSTMVDFEVIEIVDEKYTYPTLLGFHWANDNEEITKLYKGGISFEHVR